MEPEYRVGDKVIVNILPSGNYGTTINTNMLSMSGKVFTISEITHQGRLFSFKEDHNHWCWATDMFYPATKIAFLISKNKWFPVVSFEPEKDSLTYRNGKLNRKTSLSDILEIKYGII